MRLYGFLTVSTVLNLTFRATALPATTSLATQLLTERIPTSPQQHLQYGSQARPGTSSSSSSEAAAEYASSESTKEACECAEGHGSGLDNSSVTVSASAVSSISIVISSSRVTTTVIIPALTSSTQQPQSQISPPPQQVSSATPVPTYIVTSVVTPALPSLPSTITPAPASPSKAQQEGGKGQKWHQVTYWECVTWPSDYVHCGWHTPLRMGENPNPNGETFIYGSGSSLRAGAWLMQIVGVGVGLTLML